MKSPVAKLSFAALGIALVASIGFELSGLRSSEVSPVSFVSSLIALQLGVFTAWPLVAKRHGKAIEKIVGLFKEGEVTSLQDLAESLEWFKQNKKLEAPSDLALWSKKDPRLDVSLFSGNVPTMVLDHEQRILDWNPAFDLVFGYCQGIKRGTHVSKWFDHLDNFRRISKRTDKLYGEGILPMADRERVSFISSEYGRMVFRKIMTPVLNQETGRNIGWTVVLNINSVNKRAAFFTNLQARISQDTRSIRYAAAHDSIYKKSKSYKSMMMRHIDAHSQAQRVLEIGANTGMLSRGLLKQGKKVVAVENNVNLLRRLKSNIKDFPHMSRIVRQDPDEMRNLPTGRFDGAILNMTIHKFHFPHEVLRAAFECLKSGGKLTISNILPSGGVKKLHSHLRKELEDADQYQVLNQNFRAVCDYEVMEFEKNRYNLVTREELRALALEAGFEIMNEHSNLVDGHTQFLELFKRV